MEKKVFKEVEAAGYICMSRSFLSASDLNPLERHRVRETIRKYGGDQVLLSLSDEELDGALGITVDIGGTPNKRAFVYQYHPTPVSCG